MVGREENSKPAITKTSDRNPFPVHGHCQPRAAAAEHRAQWHCPLFFGTLGPLLLVVPW